MNLNDVCSIPTSVQNQSAGFGSIDTLISLVILSTTILLMMSVALRQTTQARQLLVLNQLYMQADVLVELLALHPADVHPVVIHWQANFQQIYPKALIHPTNVEQLAIHINVNPFSLKVVKDEQGSCSHKISRDDSD